MKRVLVITYYWPPAGGSGVQRWVKFAKYLPAEGWQPVIYTPLNPDAPATDRSLEADVPPEAEVLRTPIREPYGLYRRLFGAQKAEKSEVNPINAAEKPWKKKLSMWIRSNLFIPDPRRSWVRPSVRFLLKYLKGHPVDLIVSTGPPHSMHLIARDLARKTGLPWLADFRDPWTKIFYYKHLLMTRVVRRKDAALERSVLEECSAVVAVSPRVQDDFRQMTSRPVHLVTNGYDEADFAPFRRDAHPEAEAGTNTGTMPEAMVGSPSEDDSKRSFTLIHTGLFAADGDPTVLWRILAEKCAADAQFAARLRIRLAGKTDRKVLDSIRQAGLEGNLDDLGYRPHRDMPALQTGATVLLLPLRKEPEYASVLPGKLFEYLGARRPVLGIGQSDGAMAQILKETGSGETLDWNDAEGLKTYIDHHWKAFLSGKDPYAGHGAEAYERRASAARMAALMDRYGSPDGCSAPEQEQEAR